MPTYTADEISSGIRLAWAYHRKLRAYLRNPHAAAFGRGGPGPDDPAFIHYVLAARLADRLGVSYEDYVEAHFVAEDRWRGRHPQIRFLHQERGWTSAERVAAWQKLRAQPGSLGRVLAAGKAATVRAPERDATQERYLRQLCARWQVEEADILYALGGPGAAVFEQAWLRTRPLWRALDDRGLFEHRIGPDLTYLRQRRDELRGVAP